MTTTPLTAVDEFLTCVVEGTPITPDLVAEDAELDATVPGWRFQVAGAGEVAATYAQWFAHPGRFEELERHPIPSGEVVTYLLAWVEDGVPHAARHCHVLSLDPAGRISRDQFFCGGRWGASRLAEMAAAGGGSGRR